MVSTSKMFNHCKSCCLHSGASLRYTIAGAKENIYIYIYHKSLELKLHLASVVSFASINDSISGFNRITSVPSKTNISSPKSPRILVWRNITFCRREKPERCDALL